MYENKAIVKRIGETAMKQFLGNLGNKVMKTKNGSSGVPKHRYIRIY